MGKLELGKTITGGIRLNRFTSTLYCRFCLPGLNVLLTSFACGNYVRAGRGLYPCNAFRFAVHNVM